MRGERLTLDPFELLTNPGIKPEPRAAGIAGGQRAERREAAIGGTVVAVADDTVVLPPAAGRVSVASAARSAAPCGPWVCAY